MNLANKKLNIAILIRNYSFSGGGSQKYCVELTNRISKIHNVDVYTQNIGSPSDNITFHKIPQWFKKPRFINQLLFSWLTKKSTANKYDIVHSHDTVTHADIYTLHVSCVRTKWMQSKGINKILYLLNTILSPRMIAYLWLESKKMTPSENRQFISVSDHLSRNILHCYPKLKNCINIATPGINTEILDTNLLRNNDFVKLREKYNIPKSAFILLFVAHDFKRKGLPAIIKALELLNNNDIHILIAGIGNPQKINIKSDIVKTNTHFLGAVSNTDEIYPIADALIHPTLNDTFGMVPLEAMLHKLPVIISDSKYCGLSEYLNNEEAIILKNPKDIKELSTAILSVYGQPEKCKRIAENGFTKALKFKWDKTLNETLNAYQKMEIKK